MKHVELRKEIKAVDPEQMELQREESNKVGVFYFLG